MSIALLGVSFDTEVYKGRWAYDFEGNLLKLHGSDEFFVLAGDIDALLDYVRLDPEYGGEVACLDVELEAKRFGPGSFGRYGGIAYKLVVSQVLSAVPAGIPYQSCFSIK